MYKQYLIILVSLKVFFIKIIMTKTGVLQDYFQLYNRYKKEYEKMCLFIQIGAFYEIYQTESEGNADKICELVNITLTRKDKKDLTSVKMAGVPIQCIDKYIKLLVNHNYTIIIYDQQVKNDKVLSSRILKGIYSASLNHISFEDTCTKQDILTSILVEDKTVSILHLDNSINSINIIEKYNQTETDIITCIVNYQSSEYNIYTINENLILQLEKLKTDKIININIIKDIPKEYYKLNYQNDLLKEYYSHFQFGLLSPIEFLDLEFYTTSTINLLLTIQFIKNHDALFIKNLNKPIVNNEIDFLNVALDTKEQLNVLPNKNNKHRYNSLFNVINYTSTVIGRRKLFGLLSRPFKNSKDILSYHQMSSILLNMDIKQLMSILSNINDVEKLHRKMGMQILKPNEFYKLHNSYQNIYSVLMELKNIDGLDNLVFDEQVLSEYITEYTNVFYIEKMSDPSLHFLKNDTVLDNLQEKIMTCEVEMYNINSKFNKHYKQDKCIKIQSDSNGYYMSTTNSRFEVIKNKTGIIKDKRLLKSEVKFTTVEFQEISDNLMDYKTESNTRKNTLFLQTIEMLYHKYNLLFTHMNNFIGTLDILLCNVQLFHKDKYTCPILVENESSFIDCKNLRHPIIEKVLDTTKYIENDILLNDNSNIILLGYNSSGKSSLLRAIGLNIILAQCGLFTSASKFRFSIFNKLICQVDLTDDFFKHSSSFITELKGIKYILDVSDKNTLVLVDELVRGSEITSATSIFASTVHNLSKCGAKFLFTTHLHKVCDLNIIKNNQNVKICHLDVDIMDGIVIFNRKLKDGKINELYGIEIANTILDKGFIDATYKIREEILGKSQKNILKKSNYNTKKLLIKCEICNDSNALETHHIKNQCESDNSGHYKDEYFHQNTKSNLVSLCKKCHLSVTLGKIIVKGYIQTSNGILLDYIVTS
jgi:DNA mismatch repair protein MutS